jgi:hypothetical protein
MQQAMTPPPPHTHTVGSPPPWRQARWLPQNAAAARQQQRRQQEEEGDGEEGARLQRQREVSMPTPATPGATPAREQAPMRERAPAPRAQVQRVPEQRGDPFGAAVEGLVWAPLLEYGRSRRERRAGPARNAGAALARAVPRAVLEALAAPGASGLLALEGAPVSLERVREWARCRGPVWG